MSYVDLKTFHLARAKTGTHDEIKEMYCNTALPNSAQTREPETWLLLQLAHFTEFADALQTSTECGPAHLAQTASAALQKNARCPNFWHLAQCLTSLAGSAATTAWALLSPPPVLSQLAYHMAPSTQSRALRGTSKC